MKQIRKHPLWSLFAVLSAFCLLLLVSFRLFPVFSEWFARYPAAAVRIVLGFLSSVVPFSVFEISIVLFVLYLLFFLVFSFFQLLQCLRKKSISRYFGKLFLVIPTVLIMVLDLFALSFAPCYERKGVAEHMQLPMEEVTEETVFEALAFLSDSINRASPLLSKNEAGESLCPVSEKELKILVKNACSQFAKLNPFYQKTGFVSKSFLFSEWITYTHISGVFGFFTGEANVNTNYPHFVVSSAMAHEACHARGIGAENECNFLASVILLESDSPYLNYCGATALMDDFLSVCRRIDPERTNSILQNTDPVYAKDQAFYRAFFEPYRESTASVVADQTNSAYLKSMGQTEGTLSYSRVIGLFSSYVLKISLQTNS